MVDLDGAFDGAAKSRAVVARICAALTIPVQLGGGIRDLETARAYLDAGVTRCIIGTLALEKPETFAALCRAFPGRVGVSLDAEGGRLKSRGWVADTGLSVDDVLPRLQDDGAAFIIYTDIDRDGMQSGVNLPALEHLARAARVRSLPPEAWPPWQTCSASTPWWAAPALVGAVSGRALYEGTLHLEEANAWIAAQGQ